jgi:hypothetical protein
LPHVEAHCAGFRLGGDIRVGAGLAALNKPVAALNGQRGVTVERGRSFWSVDK